MISKKQRNKVMRCICDIYYEDYREKINLNIVAIKEKMNIDEVVKICVNLESFGYLECHFQKENKKISKNDKNLYTVIFKRRRKEIF